MSRIFQIPISLYQMKTAKMMILNMTSLAAHTLINHCQDDSKNLFLI